MSSEQNDTTQTVIDQNNSINIDQNNQDIDINQNNQDIAVIDGLTVNQILAKYCAHLYEQNDGEKQINSFYYPQVKSHNWQAIIENGETYKNWLECSECGCFMYFGDDYAFKNSFKEGEYLTTYALWQEFFETNVFNITCNEIQMKSILT